MQNLYNARIYDHWASLLSSKWYPSAYAMTPLHDGAASGLKRTTHLHLIEPVIAEAYGVRVLVCMPKLI